jgi:large subunit ribosomal protein L34e
MKKVKTRVPSGKIVIRMRQEKPGAAICAICKKPLHGMKRMIPSKIRKISKTEKRPSRLYGGYLCANCTKELVREKARMI